MAMITVLMWSTLAPAVKLTMTEIPTLEMLSITAGLAFLFLFLYNGLRGKLSLLRKMSPRAILKMAGLGFLGLFLYSALYYYGIDQLTSSEACILNYLCDSPVPSLQGPCNRSLKSEVPCGSCLNWR